MQSPGSLRSAGVTCISTEMLTTSPRPSLSALFVVSQLLRVIVITPLLHQNKTLKRVGLAKGYLLLKLEYLYIIRYLSSASAYAPSEW